MEKKTARITGSRADPAASATEVHGRFIPLVRGGFYRAPSLGVRFPQVSV